MKKVGDWNLMDNENSSFTAYAKVTSINNPSQYFRYSASVIKKTIPYMKKRNVAIDIGASYGFVTRPLADLFDTVYSFEVIPEVRECLKANVSFLNNVNVLDHGISNFYGKQKFNFTPARTGHSSSVRVPEPKKNKPVIAQVKKLDTLIKVDNIDFIKIDVEGAELSVLQGAEKVLIKNKPVLLIELWEDTENALKVMSFLKDMNYELVTRHIKDDYVFVNKDNK